MSDRETAGEFDAGSENLLALDGYVFFLDEAGEYWVKFEVQRVERSQQRPEGIKYSLTLHDSANRRLIGFDNAHTAKTRRVGQRGGRLDHEHHFQTTKPYRFRGVSRLLDDFWEAVDRVLRERGVKR